MRTMFAETAIGAVLLIDVIAIAVLAQAGQAIPTVLELVASGALGALAGVARPRA